MYLLKASVVLFLAGNRKFSSSHQIGTLQFVLLSVYIECHQQKVWVISIDPDKMVAWLRLLGSLID